MDMSLVELGMSVNSDFGYKTIVAKYKLMNKGTSTLALPEFQTDLTNEEGYTYTGVRQTNVAKSIAPNTSYVLSYSYMVPDSEDADKLALNLYDTNRLAVGLIKQLFKLFRQQVQFPCIHLRSILTITRLVRHIVKIHLTVTDCA